jgi:hypothetical protein
MNSCLLDTQRFADSFVLQQGPLVPEYEIIEGQTPGVDTGVFSCFFFNTGLRALRPRPPGVEWDILNSLSGCLTRHFEYFVFGY